MSWLNDVEDQMEAKAAPVGESEQLIVRDLGKEDRWKKKRCGKITSSTLPDLMKGGKGVPYGETAKKVLYPVKYERRTGIMRENKDYIKNFDWGHENEPKAVELLRQKGYDIIHSDDCEDIIFNEPFENFGDSPDGRGDGITYEIKCPVDVGKIEQLREITTIHDKSEYYWQLMAHFIGDPDAVLLVYAIYDAYSDDIHIIEVQREDHIDNIEKAITRIQEANIVVNAALAGETSINEINEFLNL